MFFALVKSSPKPILGLLLFSPLGPFELRYESLLLLFSTAYIFKEGIFESPTPPNPKPGTLFF